MRFLDLFNPFLSSSKLICTTTLLTESIKTSVNCNFVVNLDDRDIDEVIRRANATHYGLAAGVFTSNIDKANTLTRALRAGTVWVNCFDVFDAAIPFGGYKMSGQGREKGIDSLKNYLQIKAVVTSLKNPAWL